MFWETKGKEYQLLKKHWSSEREAQTITFPSYFLSELHLRKLPTFLPHCVPQNQHGSRSAYLGSHFSIQPGCRQPLLRGHCSYSTLKEPQYTIKWPWFPGVQGLWAVLNKYTHSLLLPLVLFRVIDRLAASAHLNLIHAVSVYSKQFTNQ